MENEPIKQEEIKNMSFEQIDEYLKKYYALDNQMRLMYEETSKYEIPEDKEEVEKYLRKTYNDARTTENIKKITNNIENSQKEDIDKVVNDDTLTLEEKQEKLKDIKSNYQKFSIDWRYEYNNLGFDLSNKMLDLLDEKQKSLEEELKSRNITRELAHEYDLDPENFSSNMLEKDYDYIKLSRQKEELLKNKDASKEDIAKLTRKIATIKAKYTKLSKSFDEINKEFGDDIAKLNTLRASVNSVRTQLRKDLTNYASLSRKFGDKYGIDYTYFNEALKNAGYINIEEENSLDDEFNQLDDLSKKLDEIGGQDVKLEVDENQNKPEEKDTKDENSLGDEFDDLDDLSKRLNEIGNHDVKPEVKNDQNKPEEKDTKAENSLGNELDDLDDLSKKLNEIGNQDVKPEVNNDQNKPEIKDTKDEAKDKDENKNVKNTTTVNKNVDHVDYRYKYEKNADDFRGFNLSDKNVENLKKSQEDIRNSINKNTALIEVSKFTKFKNFFRSFKNKFVAFVKSLSEDRYEEEIEEHKEEKKSKSKLSSSLKSSVNSDDEILNNLGNELNGIDLDELKEVKNKKSEEPKSRN